MLILFTICYIILFFCDSLKAFVASRGAKPKTVCSVALRSSHKAEDLASAQISFVSFISYIKLESKDCSRL